MRIITAALGVLGITWISSMTTFAGGPHTAVGIHIGTGGFAFSIVAGSPAYRPQHYAPPPRVVCRPRRVIVAPHPVVFPGRPHAVPCGPRVVQRHGYRHAPFHPPVYRTVVVTRPHGRATRPEHRTVSGPRRGGRH